MCPRAECAHRAAHADVAPWCAAFGVAYKAVLLLPLGRAGVVGHSAPAATRSVGSGKRHSRLKGGRGAWYEIMLYG